MTDIRTLDLNLLKAFVVLLDECNVSRSAQRLSITQPAMSGILNRCERVLMTPYLCGFSTACSPQIGRLSLGMSLGVS